MIDVIVHVSGGAVQGIAVSDETRDQVNVILVDFDNIGAVGEGEIDSEEDIEAKRQEVGPYPTEPLSTWPASDDPDEALFWARPHLTKPLEVAAVISSGELSPEAGDTAAHLIDRACGPLDRAYAADILGPVLVLGKDGRFYGVWTEAVIGEASQEFVRSCVEETFEPLDETAVFVRPGSTNDHTGYGYKVAGTDVLTVVRMEPDGRVVVVPTPCVLTREQHEVQIGTWCHPDA